MSIKSQVFDKIMNEHNTKITNLLKKQRKISEITDRKLVTAAVLAVLKNPEYREHFNITPVSYDINVFGNNFDPSKSTSTWGDYIKKYPYYIGHPQFEKAVTMPDLLREYALYADLTSIKYIKNPTVRHLMIIATYKPELLEPYSIPQEVQNYILKTNITAVKHITAPSKDTAVSLMQINPCFIIYLPVAVRNYPEVLSAFISNHYASFKNINALKAFKDLESLEIPDKVFSTLSRLEKRIKSKH